MQTEFTNSFVKDLRKLNDKELLTKVKRVILEIETADSTANIKNIKFLVKSDNYYRIRVGDYRLGLKLDNDIITLVRCLHRKDIYKRFP